MIFIVFMAFWASLWYLFDYYQSQNWLLLVLSIAVNGRQYCRDAGSILGDFKNPPRRIHGLGQEPSNPPNEIACAPAEAVSAGHSTK